MCLAFSCGRNLLRDDFVIINTCFPIRINGRGFFSWAPCSSRRNVPWHGGDVSRFGKNGSAKAPTVRGGWGAAETTHKSHAQDISWPVKGNTTGKRKREECKTQTETTGGSQASAVWFAQHWGSTLLCFNSLFSYWTIFLRSDDRRSFPLHSSYRVVIFQCYTLRQDLNRCYIFPFSQLWGFRMHRIVCLFFYCLFLISNSNIQVILGNTFLSYGVLSNRYFQWLSILCFVLTPLRSLRLSNYFKTFVL